MDSSNGRLSGEILELYGLGAFSFWQWNPEGNRLSTHGAFVAESLEEWITRIHPRDQAVFSAFLDREWSVEDPPSTVEYRFGAQKSGEWTAIRQTGKLIDVEGGKTLSCLVEPIGHARGSRTSLDRLERQFVEDGFMFERFVESAITLAEESDPMPLLEQVRRRLGAGIVTHVNVDSRFEVRDAVSSVCEAGGFTPPFPTDHLRSVLSDLDPDGELETVSFDLEGAEDHLAHYLVRPVTTRNRRLAGALCVGFRTSGDRDGAARHRGLLSLAAAFNACRLNREHDEIHRRELLDQLWRAQRLSGLGRLSGGFAHDLKNLVTVVQGHLHLLEQQLDAGDLRGGHESLRQIRRSSEEAAESAGRLLFLGGGAVAPLRPCDLNTVVERFMTMMRRVLEETIEVRLDLDPEIPAILADEAGLREVMMNLIVNARDAMPGGGTVVVETRKESRPRVGGAHAFVSLRIRDLAAAGPCEHGSAERIAPDWNAAGSDNSLAMHHVAKIVADHGGQIETCSKSGTTSCIGILLPAAREDLARSNPGGLLNAGRSRGTGKQRLGAADLKGTTILLVEDELAVRKLVRKLLEVLGCQVVEASSGREALDLWPGIRHRVSLVVSDIVMPEGISGWDLAKELRRRHPDLGILLTSGYSELPEDHGLGGVPQISYLQKPYGVEVLRDHLSRLLALESLPR